jgi:hypothetical protein
VPTPRKKSSSHRLNGSWQTNPGRAEARARELRDPRVLGTPPTSLTAAQRRCWREIERTCTPGILRRSDRIAVHLASALFDEFLTAGSTMAAAKIARLENLLASFGMNPVSRTKITRPDDFDSGPNPFDECDDPPNPFAVHDPRSRFCPVNPNYRRPKK